MTTNLMKQPPLRLMVYDRADRKKNIRDLRAGISDRANEIIDAILPDDIEDLDFDVPLGLSHTWFGGGMLYKALGRIDECKGFFSWEEALAWLNNVHPQRKISQIQYWGHGSPGRVWMLEDGALDKNSFTGKHTEALTRLKKRLTPDAQIWFRCCGVFAGVHGHKFAYNWADNMNCMISAHTHIIGFWHAGAHNIFPGNKPHWPLDEGLDDDGKMIVSTRTSPNRLWFMSNEVPGAW